jgi:hypothetical protein
MELSPTEHDYDPMILWRSNQLVDDDLIDQVRDEIVEHKDSKSDSDKNLGMLHSTYFIRENKPDLKFLKIYQNIVGHIVGQTGLHNSDTTFDYWTQVYNGSHCVHNHFACQNIISFVHFIRPTDKKCFYFDLLGEKIYPKQDKGDIIVFPSWAHHGVETSYGNERVTVAGNLMWSMIRNTDVNNTYVQQVTVVRKGLSIFESFNKD